MIVFFQLDSNLTIWEPESWKKAQVFDHRCARFNLTENSCIFFEHRRIEYDLWTEIIKSTWIQTCFTLCLIYLLIGIPIIYLNRVSKSNLIQYHTTMVFCYQNCSDLLWEKIVLVIEKNFWNSRLKAENFQNFWDHLNNLFKQWKVRTIFGNRMLF